MKIVFIDMATDGHHIEYLQGIIRNMSDEVVLIVPNRIVSLNCKQYIYSHNEERNRNLIRYYKWLEEIENIINQEKPNCIHFLTGDYFYRYFGLGLKKFKAFYSVMTFHWVRSGILQKFSLMNISKKVNRIIIHSQYLENQIRSIGVENAITIDYPQFNERIISKKKACNYWGMSIDIPIIACIGNTRQDKGLDILLDALKKVELPFQLLVAGKPEAFDHNFIQKEASSYLENLCVCLHYLTETELCNAIGASDIIALPYRKTFNGASGPLVQGIWMKKCILGPNHGNLNYIINSNDLGYTFKTENVDSLANMLNLALSVDFEINHLYDEYRQSLDPQIFAKKYQAIYKQWESVQQS